MNNSPTNSIQCDPVQGILRAKGSFETRYALTNTVKHVAWDASVMNQFPGIKKTLTRSRKIAALET